jgi:glutamine amidotransferase
MTSTPLIAVLDYGIGNLRSAQKALQRVGADARLVTSSQDAVIADAVVLPGVGAFGACMNALRTSHLEDVVHTAVASGKPFLGICVGMQMLFTSSQESPDARGLGVIDGEVQWIASSLPRPQMQWNQLTITREDPMFDGLGDNPWMYFVHSLHGVPSDPSHVVATTHYGDSLNVAFRKDNVFATQFHPEKSAAFGLRLLQNFVSEVMGVQVS